MGKNSVVRGEVERLFNRHLTRLSTHSHPIPVKGLSTLHLFPHPQTSTRIICACSGLVGTTANRETWLTKKIEDLAIADCGLIASELSCARGAVIKAGFSDPINPQSAILVTLRFAYPYVRAVVGIQAESICRRANKHVGMRESLAATSTNKKTVRISRLPQG